MILQFYLSKVASIFDITSQIKDTSQISYLQNEVKKLKLNDEGFVSSVYHLLFELQDLKVSELAAAQTQGNITDNMEAFRKIGDELLASRISNPKLKYM